jgi:MFS family permease
MKMNENSNFSKLNTFAVMVIPLLWLYEAAVIGGGVSYIMRAFPETTVLQGQLVMTAPFLTVFIFSFIAGILAKYFDKKTILIVGLLLYGITGITPIFAHDINTVLILRYLTGVGTGLIVPLPNAIISENFRGQKRDRLLSLTSSVTNFASLFFNILIGVLLTFIGWKVSFYAFALVFVVLIIVIAWLPKCPPISKTEEKSERSGGQLSLITLGLFALMLFNFLMLGTVLTNFSLIFAELKFAPWLVGFAMALPGGLAMIMGIIAPDLMGTFKKHFAFVAFAAYAIGFLIMASAASVALVFVAAGLIGVGNGAIAPFVFILTADKVKPEHRDFAYGLVGCGMQLGSYLNPWYQQLVAMIAGKNTFALQFTTAGVLLIIAAVVSALYAFISTGGRPEGIENNP